VRIIASPLVNARAFAGEQVDVHGVEQVCPADEPQGLAGDGEREHERDERERERANRVEDGAQIAADGDHEADGDAEQDGDPELGPGLGHVVRVVRARWHSRLLQELVATGA
jgi:hypothetical protein